MTDWQAQLSTLEATLVDELQRGFPVEQRPFRTLAERFDSDEEAVVSAVRSLDEQGIFRRVGPVFNPPVIGSSTLAAVSVPPERFDRAAEIVNGYSEVNHNYRRDHEWNMWFVVTASSRDRRNQILQEIEAATGSAVLTLPMRTQYYIGLEFPVVNDDPVAWSQANDGDVVRISGRSLQLSTLQRRVIRELQDGFERTATPYRAVANALDERPAAICEAVETLREEMAIKRIGGIVNHHRVGFDENCMVVWQVPEADLDAVGPAAGTYPSVTYCCHRPRRTGMDWPYTLFTMIHGRTAEAVDETIDSLADSVLPYEHDRLYTTSVLKQTGVRYPKLVEPADPRVRTASDSQPKPRRTRET